MPVVVLSHPLADATAGEYLAARTDVRLPSDDSQIAFVNQVHDADAVIIRAPARLNDSALVAAPRLRVVANIGAGIDHIDTTALDSRGIELLIGTGANADAVAEWVIWALLSLSRRFDHAAAFADGAEQAWATRIAALRGTETAGGVLGVIGFGHIGRSVARMARQGLGLRVAVFDPALQTTTDDVDIFCPNVVALLDIADAVTVHVPLTESTRGLIGDAELRHLGSEGILLNSSRGGVVDESALISALRDHRLRGAAIDVFDAEPPTAQRLHELAGVPRLLITPHIAGISDQAGSAFAWAAVRGVLRALGQENRPS